VSDGQEVAGQVRAAEDRRYAAMIAGDVAALGELLSDRAVYTHSYGGRDTKQELLDVMSRGELVYHSVEHPVTEVIVLGDAAVVVGEMHAEVTSRGSSRQLANATIAVWGVEDGQWRMVAFQSTRLPG
jgi:ketosteroid isomerase-like protein